MSETEDAALPAKLRRLVETIDIANVLIEPLTRSMEQILEVSAEELNSAEASVLIRDGSDGDLRFLTAIGRVADQVLKIKIPAGKGIAGFVFSSGQPMAVSDVSEAETFYAEVDKTTGYSTQMILATPLSKNGEIVGVLEYINRSGQPPYEPFTPEEMDKAARFAEPIASLVNAYESAKLLCDLGGRVIADDQAMEMNEIRAWLSGVRAAPEHREMIDLALLLGDVAGRGASQRKMCREVLESIVRYADSQNESSFLNI